MDTKALVELGVMTSISDSWELPSYLAGDVLDMGRYRRDRDRFVVPDQNWRPGQDARIHEVDFAGTHDMRQSQRDLAMLQANREKWSNPTPPHQMSDIEPYDPKKHLPPAELYSQDSLEALHRAGFEPHEDGVWHRPVTTDQGEHLGASHIITYEPGHRRPSDGSRAPWHLMTDPETAGIAFSTLRGPRGALAAADEDVAQIRKMPKQARLYLSAVVAFVAKNAAAQSPGRQNAEDWLANNSDKSFEHDPREEARRWMDEHAHEYDEWHPESDDTSTYSDFRDPAGMTFHEGEEEGRAHVLPGQEYDFGGHGWESASVSGTRSSPSWVHNFGRDEDHDDYEEALAQQHSQDPDILTEHGFDWEPLDSTAGSTENPYTPDTPGRYFTHQVDPEGNHVATHRLTPETNNPGMWSLSTELTEHGLPVTFPQSRHGSLDDALDKYKRNSAEAMLPRYGYEFGRDANNNRVWMKRTPNPSGGPDYEHTIHFPDNGFMGETDHVSNGSSFAPQGNVTHSSHDLSDIVHEQNRLSQGLHPGGARDHRLTPSELRAHPSVALLGPQETTHVTSGHGENRVNRMTWHIAHPDAPKGVNVTANYNWDKGGYNFRYTHDGTLLAPTHSYVPEGSPVHVPGRPPQR